MIRHLIFLLALPLSAFALHHEGNHKSADAYVQDQEPIHMHEMQHGFILSNDDRFGSHLVANGHHSRQAEITGELVIEDSAEKLYYDQRKALNSGRAYFLFQAQHLDLPSITDGQILNGHIVESPIGQYEPKNVIVQEAKFKIEKVILNVENPFFGQE